MRTGREEVDHGAERPRPETFRVPLPSGEGPRPRTGDDANDWPASSTGGARRVSICGATASSGECGRSTGDAPRPAGQRATDPVVPHPAPLNACAPMVRLSGRTQDRPDTGHQSKGNEERAAPKWCGPSRGACRVSPSLFPEEHRGVGQARGGNGSFHARSLFHRPTRVRKLLDAGCGQEGGRGRTCGARPVAALSSSATSGGAPRGPVGARCGPRDGSVPVWEAASVSGVRGRRPVPAGFPASRAAGAARRPSRAPRQDPGRGGDGRSTGARRGRETRCAHTGRPRTRSRFGCGRGCPRC